MTPDPPAPAARSVRWRRWVIPVLVVVALLAVVRGFLVQTYVIPSDSMEPTLKTTDRILVDKVDASDVHRGDVVVFDGSAFGDHTAYVKRVIGVGGDEVSCCTQDGRLSLDGEPLDEPYVKPGDAPSRLRFDVRVPAGRLWVMGDHRSDSGDSRAHLGDPGGGMVPVDDVIGEATWRYWPPSDFGRLDDRSATVGSHGGPAGKDARR